MSASCMHIRSDSMKSSPELFDVGHALKRQVDQVDLIFTTLQQSSQRKGDWEQFGNASRLGSLDSKAGMSARPWNTRRRQPHLTEGAQPYEAGCNAPQLLCAVLRNDDLEGQRALNQMRCKVLERVAT